MIEYATAQLNAEVNGKVTNERIRYIDETKENEIDGSNTTYYLQIADIFPIGDKDDDGDVDTSDLDVFTVDGDGTKSSVTVSSITPADGKFVLETAPTSDLDLYCTYKYALLDEETPHPLIKKACIELTGALAFTKINAKQISQIRLGDLTITKQARAFDVFYNNYKKTLKDIKGKIARKAKIREGRTIPTKFGSIPDATGDTWWPALGLQRAKDRDFL